MLKVAIDVDGVLADFVLGALPILSEVSGKDVIREDITEWNFCKAIGMPEIGEDFWPRLTEKGFCLSLEELTGAMQFMEGIKELAAQGLVDYRFVTSPLKSGKGLSEHWCHERVQWLLDHGFAESCDQVIFGHSKEWIDGDVLIDDGPHNFTRGRKANLLLNAAHNRAVDGDFTRVYGLAEALEVIEGLAKSQEN